MAQTSRVQTWKWTSSSLWGSNHTVRINSPHFFPNRLDSFFLFFRDPQILKLTQLRLCPDHPVQDQTLSLSLNFLFLSVSFPSFLCLSLCLWTPVSVFPVPSLCALSLCPPGLIGQFGSQHFGLFRFSSHQIPADAAGSAAPQSPFQIWRHEGKSQY